MKSISNYFYDHEDKRKRCSEMYVELDLNDLPPGNSKVWHYLDFAKFLFLISEKKLHFSSARQLSDEFEGSLPKYQVEFRDDRIKRICTERRKEDEAEKLIDRNRDLSRRFQKYMHVNCWHLNEDESLAMWSLYSMPERGMAIQSTIDRMIACFRKVPKYDISLGKVEYIDYSEWDGRLESPIQRFLLKRKSFSFEHEIRALTPGGDSPPGDEHLRGRGIDVMVDLLLLIEKIYVSPQSPNWFLRLVGSMVDRFGLDVNVHRSGIGDEALF